MIPLLSVAAMRDCEARYDAPGHDALVRSAGTAVGIEAKRMLGGCYGARVAVVVGPGFNGGDGRVAGAWLKSRGAHVTLIEVRNQPEALFDFDLVIDAAFGIGCSRPYVAPLVEAGTCVLAVDVPSGVDADTGELFGSPMKADVTLAMGAYKYAHVTGPAQEFTGELRFLDLDMVEEFRDGVLEDSDLVLLGTARRDDHKWKHALSVFAGSPLMPGAAELAVRGALATGASMIRLQSHGDLAATGSFPPEVVRTLDVTLDARSQAVVAGPGLGPDAAPWLRERLGEVKVPVVLDADALERDLVDELAKRTAAVLTPHEGEYQRLLGDPVGVDRLASVRRASAQLGCVVLLKGPTTVVADPSGALRVVLSGTSALATAGSGDVLSGMIGATLARGHEPLAAASLAAHLHGRAGARLSLYAPASSIPGEVTNILDELRRAKSHGVMS